MKKRRRSQQEEVVLLDASGMAIWPGQRVLAMWGSASDGSFTGRRFCGDTGWEGGRVMVVDPKVVVKFDDRAPSGCVALATFEHRLVPACVKVWFDTPNNVYELEARTACQRLLDGEWKPAVVTKVVNGMVYVDGERFRKDRMRTELRPLPLPESAKRSRQFAAVVDDRVRVRGYDGVATVRAAAVGGGLIVQFGTSEDKLVRVFDDEVVSTVPSKVVAPPKARDIEGLLVRFFPRCCKSGGDTTRVFLGSTSRAQLGVTQETYKFKLLTTELCSFFNDRAFPGFKYTTILVNLNCSYRAHRHASNLGSSYIVGFGDYTGGELWVDGHGLYDIKHRPLQFCGREYHANAPCTNGWRVSVVAFCHDLAFQQQRSFSKCQNKSVFLDDLRSQLADFGFRLPTGDDDDDDDPIIIIEEEEEEEEAAAQARFEAALRRRRLRRRRRGATR